jgi:hypothetical protein
MPGIELPPGALQTTVVPATSGKAIASLVLGLFSWLFPAAILAIIFGHISRGEIRRSNGRLKGAGMALAGLIMGYCAIAIIPFLIVAAIAIPNLLRSRIAANEASAVGSLRTLNTAEITYNTIYPSVGFACSLGALGPPSGSASPTSTAAGLIDSRLASGTKSGYTFTVGSCSTKKGITIDYQWVAIPQTPGTTGQRYFCTDDSGVIKFSATSASDCLRDGMPI